MGRMLEGGQRWRRAAEGLGGVLLALNADQPLDAVLDLVLDHAIDVLGADAGALFRFRDDDNVLTVHTSRGLESWYTDHIRVARGRGTVGNAVDARRPVAIPDLLDVLGKDPRFAPAPLPGDDLVLRLSSQYRAIFSVPLVAKDVVHGAVSLYYRAPRTFPEGDIALAATFADQAALAVQNARLRDEAARRMRELEALYRADERLYRSLELDEVLQALVDVAADVLGADKATVMIWDERRERLVPGAARGFSPATLALMQHEPREGVTTLVATTGQPVAIEDAAADSRVAHQITDAEQIRSLVHVPIVVDGQVFGVFGINYVAPRRFVGDEQRLLLALAHRAGLAIENARLYARAREAAALEERQRLARDLHDAVTQTLFSASLIADVLPAIWRRDPTQGAARLEELRVLNRGALAEMRTLLLELRPDALLESDLPDLLRQLVEAFHGRVRVEASLDVHGDRKVEADVQVALYRIAQEALNNVAKHAQATRVTLTLRLSDEQVDLTVVDDGRGFDPDAAAAGHLGLEIMRERAAAIGAVLRVASRPGDGTRLTVVWPAP
jgi:signal transduction histidine kinase